MGSEMCIRDRKKAVPLGEEPPFKKCAPLSRLKGLTPCEDFVLTLGKLPHLFKAALVSPGPSEASSLCSSRENRKGLDGCEEKEGCRAPGDAPKSLTRISLLVGFEQARRCLQKIENFGPQDEKSGVV